MMMIMVFILIFVQLLMKSQATEMSKHEAHLPNENCFPTGKKSIIIYLDCEKVDLQTGELDRYDWKIRLMVSSLRYLSKMLVGRSNCFQLSLFSNRRGNVVRLTENSIIENVLDYETPVEYSVYDFSHFYDLLPNNTIRNQTLLYVSLREDYSRDNSLITKQLKSVQAAKGFDVIFLCMIGGPLCSLAAQWVPRNRLLYYGEEMDAMWINHLDNFNKELLDAIKNPYFDRFQIYKDLNLLNSSFGECKIRMYFWMEIDMGDDVAGTGVQDKSNLLSRLMHFFHQKIATPVELYSAYILDDGFGDKEFKVKISTNNVVIQMT